MSKKKSKKAKKTSWVAKIAAAAACVTAVFTAAHFFIPTDTPFLTRLFPHWDDSITARWNSLDMASILYSDKSNIIVLNDNSDNTYDCGVEFDLLYSNYSNKQRQITAFTVTATNIVVDYTPVFEYSYTYEESELAATESILNNGWGSSGELIFELTDLYPNSQSSADAVTVSLRDTSPTTWTYPALEPGEHRLFTFVKLEDLEIEYHQPTSVSATYIMEYTVRNRDNSFSSTFCLGIYIYPDDTYFFNSALGGGPLTYYVVEVDTQESTWTRTFQITQPLPPAATVNLPIFIMPDRSCSMDLKVTFETNDGKILETEVLEDATFLVPYHQLWTDYVSGEFIDWNQDEEDRFVYFPYEISNQYLPNLSSLLHKILP